MSKKRVQKIVAMIKERKANRERNLNEKNQESTPKQKLSKVLKDFRDCLELLDI